MNLREVGCRLGLVGYLKGCLDSCGEVKDDT